MRTPIPDAIRNAPYLHPSLQFFYSAFWTLSTERQIGMSLGPIPWSRIIQFAQWHGLDEESTDYLERVVRALDLEYLSYHAKKAKAQQK